MTPHSATDKPFLDILHRWMTSSPEILLLIRFSRAAGEKSFEFFTSFDALQKRIRELPPQAEVTVFREPQLSIRGTVDDAFIERCLLKIPDHTEFVVVETTRRTAGAQSWFHHAAGESHSELREALARSQGRLVAAGIYPHEDKGMSAVVPQHDGTLKPGIY